MVPWTLLMELAIVVMTKSKDKDGVTKYQVYRRVSQSQFYIIYKFSHMVYSPFH